MAFYGLKIRLLFTDLFRIRIRNVYFGSGSDPAKSFGSSQIRIRNTGDRNIFLRLYQRMLGHTLSWRVQPGVQRRAVGMIVGLKSRDCRERLKELGLTTMEEWRHQLDMVSVQDCEWSRRSEQWAAVQNGWKYTGSNPWKVSWKSMCNKI